MPKVFGISFGGSKKKQQPVAAVKPASEVPSAKPAAKPSDSEYIVASGVGSTPLVRQGSGDSGPSSLSSSGSSSDGSLRRGTVLSSSPEKVPAVPVQKTVAPSTSAVDPTPPAEPKKLTFAERKALRGQLQVEGRQLLAEAAQAGREAQEILLQGQADALGRLADKRAAERASQAVTTR